MGFRGRLIRLSVIIAVIALVLLAASSVGTRGGIFGFQIGLMVFALAALVGALAILLALVGLIWTLFAEDKSGLRTSVIALIVGAGVVAMPAYFVLSGLIAKYPPIHDVTTDTVNPPQFVDVMERRGKHSNPVDYAAEVVPANMPGAGGMAGRSVASIQQEYYPDIKPLTLNMSEEDAYWVALETAMGMGWEIVASDIDRGHIEATATTRWFGFKDDVVIRLTPDGDEKTRLDIRSCSRVGGGDVGTNAKRVRKYLAKVQNAHRSSK